MKLKITYEKEAELEPLLNLILPFYPRAKVKKSERHPPVKHAYIHITNSKKPHGYAEND